MTEINADTYAFSDSACNNACHNTDGNRSNNFVSSYHIIPPYIKLFLLLKMLPLYSHCIFIDTKKQHEIFQNQKNM